MKLKLKEAPREWLKFTAVMAVAASALTFLLHHRHVIGWSAGIAIWAALVLAVLVCVFRPRWFRGFYRVGMTASFHVGQVMGAILLTVFFLLAVTPMACLLRLLGKDLLAMKRGDVSSYWRKARTPGPFDRQF